MMIVNDDSRVANKLKTSLTDDARVIIYDCYMFIVQTTGWKGLPRARTLSFKISFSVMTKKKVFIWLAPCVPGQVGGSDLDDRRPDLELGGASQGRNANHARAVAGVV
jgi:hypothetical protein